MPTDQKNKTTTTTSSAFGEPGSAIITPSSITHKMSPILRIRQRELDPAEDTGKDTQNLVEEDKSDC